MLRAIIKEKQHIILEEVAIPQPQEGEIVIAIKSALTCGSDKKAWLNGAITPIGREFSGTVHAIGEGVTKFQVGQDVMTTCSSSCHTCEVCERERESYCDNFEANMTHHGLAQYAVLSADVVKHNTFVKPQELSFTQAAFLEPLSLVLHSLSQLTIHNEDAIVILGSGALGLLQLLALRATASPKTIILVGTDKAHLEMARQLGADYTVNPQEENLQETVKRYTDDYGAQIIIDNASVPESWDCMLSLASKAATLMTCGGCPSDYLLQLDATRVHYDQMTIIGTSNYSGNDVQKAQQLLANGTINPLPLITATISLQDLDSAFSQLASGEAVKFAILP